MADPKTQFTSRLDEAIDLATKIAQETEDPVQLARFVIDHLELVTRTELSPSRIRRCAAMFRALSVELEVLAAKREAGLEPARSEA